MQKRGAGRQERSQEKEGRKVNRGVDEERKGEEDEGQKTTEEKMRRKK